MNYLIDTHIAIWALINHNKLNDEFTNIIKDLNNKIYISVVTVWEVAIKNIKQGYKKMPLDEKQFVKLCEEMEFEFLPIKINHIFNIRNLKFKDKNIIHKDPFDKLLLSQSICENLTLCTRDTQFLNYEVGDIKIV